MKLTHRTLHLLVLSSLIAVVSGCAVNQPDRGAGAPMSANPSHAQSGGGMGGNGGMEGGGMDMKDMHKHMEKMNDMMAQMNRVKTPEERQKLMEEHMREMQDHMSMMRKMMGNDRCENAASEPQQQECLRQMKGNMQGMMHMMDQMMKRQKMSAQPSAPMGSAKSVPTSPAAEEEHSHDHSE